MTAAGWDLSCVSFVRFSSNSSVISQISMSEEKRVLSLPAPIQATASEAMVERSTIYQAQSDPGGADDTAVPMSHYLWLLNRDKWKVLAFVVVVVVSTVIVSSRMTPIYQATATIDIDRMQPTGVVGQ